MFPNLSATERTVLSIDSRSRVNPLGTKPNRYSVFLRNGLYRVNSVKLLTTEIPNSQDIINGYHNLLDFQDEKGVHLATLPVGNFNAAELCDQIDTAMTLVSTVIYHASYDISSGRITIGRDPTINNDKYSLLFGTGVNKTFSPSKLLGYFAVDYTGAIQYEGSSMINLSGENYVYLRIKGMQALQTSQNHSDIFAKIIWDSPPRYMTFNNFASNTVIWNPPLPSLQNLDIEFVQHDGTLYDFNEFDHSFSIEVITSRQ
jgi:hypothetical protein